MAELRISVRVRPGASRTQVGGSYGDDHQLVVAVTARPVDGAATDAVVKAVADALGVRPARVRLVTGHTSRSKVLAIDIHSDEEALRERVRALLC